MTPFTLKSYQQASLGTLRAYLGAARILGAAPAFNGMERPGIRNPAPTPRSRACPPSPMSASASPPAAAKPSSPPTR